MNLYNHNILANNELPNIFYYSKCNRLHKTSNHIKNNNSAINFCHRFHNYLNTMILRLIYFVKNAIVCIYKQTNNVNYLLDNIASYICNTRNILDNSELKITIVFYMQSLAYCCMSLCEK